MSATAVQCIGLLASNFMARDILSCSYIGVYYSTIYNDENLKINSNALPHRNEHSNIGGSMGIKNHKIKSFPGYAIKLKKTKKIKKAHNVSNVSNINKG